MSETPPKPSDIQVEPIDVSKTNPGLSKEAQDALARLDAVHGIAEKGNLSSSKAIEEASKTDKPTDLEKTDITAIVPGDIVTSTKSSGDEYYTPGAAYTVQAVRLNRRTGKYEYHVTNIDTKDGGPTKSYILSESDITAINRPDAAVRSNENKITVIDLSDGGSSADGEGHLPVRNKAPIDAAPTPGDASTAKEIDTPEAESDGSSDEEPVEIELLTDEQRTALQEIIDRKKDLLTDEQREALIALASRKNEPTQTEISAEDAKQAEREVKLREITEALDDTMIGRRLKAKLDEYAARKADVETKGGDPSKPWHTGRRKREEALKRAELDLFEAQREYTKALITERWNTDGIYDGDEAERNQVSKDDFFNEFRKLDSNARKATLATRLDRIENRNIFQKGLVAVGRFLNGGKGKGWLRNAGSGFGFGALKGFGTGLCGAGVPITIAVLGLSGTALSAGVRAGSKMNMLDKSLGEYDTEGMSDEEYGAYVRAMQQSGAGVGDQAQRMANEFFGRARGEGNKALSAARDKAKKNAMKFGIGFAAGGFSGRRLHSAVTADQGGINRKPSTPKYQTIQLHEGSVGSGADVAPSIPKTFEFPMNASHITAGEGWYHQFADMGLGSDQAQSLFADHNLMNKLVEQGAAYVDNSSQVGGYGIKLPVGGNLSPEAMKTIKQAIIAKGYIN